MLLTELRPYQREAVDAALQYDGFALFPEQRTGKCLIALAIVDHYKPDAIVIVSPKKALLTWETEIEKHLDQDWDGEFFLVTYQEPVKNLRLRKEYYKWAAKFKGNLMVIADEAHMIKKPGSAQSRFVRTIGKRAKWRLALTGTPADKGYEQYWALYDFIQNKEAFGTFEEFKSRYVVYDEKERKDGRKYKVISGYQRGPELLEIIHRFSYRITFNEARVAMGKRPVRIRKKKVYFKLFKKTRRLYRELEEDLEVTIGGLTIEAPLPITMIQKLQQVCGGFLLHQERIPGKKKKVRIVVPIGDEKLICLMEVLSGLGKKHKVVICARFTHEIEAIREQLTAFKWTHKEISGTSEWDGKFNKDVVVLQVKSGVGFDLSESNTYIFYSWDHSYITFEQSRFRIMNMEDTEQVNYYFLMAKETIEDEYYQAVARKKDFAKLVLDRYPKTQAAQREGTARKGARRIRKAGDQA